MHASLVPLRVCSVHGKGKSVPVGTHRNEDRHESGRMAALSPQVLLKSSGGSLNPPQPPPLPMHCCYLQKPPEFPDPCHPLGALEPQQLTKIY